MGAPRHHRACENLPSQTRRRGERRWGGGVGRDRECEDGRPTHPRCRTVCHCSRPSCRRHARRLPGYSIAGAHRLRAPPEESPPDGTVSCAYPTRRGRSPAGGVPPHSGGRWGGLRPLLAIPRLRRMGTRGRPPPLESAFGAGGRSAAESPRPGAAQRLAAPPPPGPHPPAPIPPAVGAEPSGAGGRGSRVLPPPPGAPCAPAASPGEGAAATCCGCPERAKDSRPGAARPRAGLLLAPGASSRRPASITAGAPGRKAGPEMRGLLKGQRAFSGSGSPPQPGRRPCAPPANCSGERRKACSWLNLTIVLFPAGSLMSKMSFRVSLEIPWVCLQIRPVLGVVAFRINTRRKLILSDSSRYACRPPPVAPTFGSEAGTEERGRQNLKGNLAGSQSRAKDIPRLGAGGFLAQNF